MKQRIITGVVAGGVFVAMLALGGYWYFGLVLLLAIIGYDEYVKMMGLKSFTGTCLLGLAAMLAITVPWDHIVDGGEISVSSVLWFLMLALLTVTVVSKNKLTIDHAAFLVIGVLYMGFGFHYMIATRWLEPHGLFWTLLVFFCIWASDSGAYFTGKAFGKTPLWPAISPNKTIEGSFGGLLLSVIVAAVFSWLHPEHLSMLRAVGLGLLIGAVGQMGDLIQSAYKRVKGIKDTGTLLPGHGGVLDRVDSWLIVFPFLHLISMIPS
ncbi:phosphatidate cytidylyltransferase [Gorillibacterium sp. sgz5001074]|uniref:phosphatidate cytidylyltransferase n=1 Tax=Gorillibacterium sp. sgz5001074 TaxID=3446695 RepID=UPI003F66DA05